MSENIAKSAVMFSEAILDAFDSSTELTYVSFRVKPPPWDTVDWR